MRSLSRLCATLCLALSAAIGFQPAIAQQFDPKLVSELQKAQSEIAAGSFESARETIGSALKEFGDQPPTWYLHGYSYHAEKKYDEALESYRKADKLASGKGANTLYNMACIYAVRGKNDEAFKTLDQAIQAGFNNLGHIASDPELANLKGDPRFAKYQPKWLDDSELFVEKTRIIHKWSGENAGDQFGWTARRVGDMDGDGVIDFVATAPTFKQGAGKIYVYSSKSGKLLHEIEGKPGFRLGNSSVGLGDVNGDGVPDFIAGASNANGKGAAFVYSGTDASVLHQLDGKTPGGNFGYEVSELGDIDADGTPDFLVGEMAGVGQEPGSGRVVAYSGRSGMQLFELKGEQAKDGFGNAAAAARMSKDTFLLAVGAQNAGESDRGTVYVYAVKDAKPTLKFKIEGTENSVNLGQMFLSFPGDLNEDGVPDVYASDFSDSSRVQGGGRVCVYSGTDGSELLAIEGQTPGEGLGTSPSDAGDVDGDGIGDLVVGAWQNREGAASGGKVYLYSCAGQGRLLRSWTCKQSGDTLGFDACGIGDVDGDGHTDFLLTSAWSNKRGQKTGRVFIVAGEDYSDNSTDAADSLSAGAVSTLIDDIEAGSGGLNIDKAGNLYAADFGSRLDGQGTGGHRIYRVSPDGQSHVFYDQLRGGSGNTFDSAGNLFQSSIGGGFITKISPSGQGEVYCNKGLKSPVGVVANEAGELFVCNCGSNTIQKISAGGESKVFCDSPLLKCPNGITRGTDGMMYVCNFGNGDVVQIDRNGNANKLATLPGNNNGHLIFHQGFLYVLARTDCRVYRVDLAGRVEVFAGSGKRGKDDGVAKEATFSLPNSLIVSPDGKYMYVNEVSPTEGDHRILAPTRIRRIELLKR